MGFIVHGLWPEAYGGRSPESCGTTRRYRIRVVDFALPVMLSPGLIQHEWATHGICTGLNPFDYFSAAGSSSRRPSRSLCRLPRSKARSPKARGKSRPNLRGQSLFSAYRFPHVCPGRVFQEERICFDKNLKPRACTAAAGDCTSPAIVIRPPL